MRGAFRKFLEQPEFHVLLAEEASVPLGYAIYELREQPGNAFKQSRRLFYIHQIAVASAFRRKGIGKALCDHIVARSRDAGIARIELNFWIANTSARRFYTALGFTPIQEVMELNVNVPKPTPLLRRAARKG